MKCPLPVIVIGLLLIVTGALGFVFHLSDFNSQHPFQFDVVGVAVVRLLAIVAGVYLLRGESWARWLVLGWMAFHVAISFLNSWPQVAFHAAMCAAFAYVLFYTSARRYFRSA